MADERLVAMARRLLTEYAQWREDARVGAVVGNTAIGSVVSMVTKAPRWAAEEAVREALAWWDAERRTRSRGRRPRGERGTRR